MQVFIDADACPVKDETLKVAARHGLPVFIVSNGGMRPVRDPNVTIIVVPPEPDAADDWIADHVRSHDVVVTQDIPLAKRTLEAGGAAIGPNGKEFTEHSIGMAMAVRDLNQHIREANQTQTRHRPFSAKDRSVFLQTLDRTITASLKREKTA